MTGFGRAAGALSARYFVAITAKSVNHRFLETSVRIPEYCGKPSHGARPRSDTFARGKVDISIRVQRTAQPDYSVRINTQIANTVVPQLRAIAEELGLGSTFSGGDLLRIPDLLQVEAIDSEITEEEREALAALVRSALALMRDMRVREGISLHTDITARLQTIRELQQRLALHRDDIRTELLASYQSRVQEIARWPASRSTRPHRPGSGDHVEKGDVAEELTRLAHHVEQAEKAVSGGEAAGRKLDFLSQEMLREVNTMGSKSRSAALRTLVVELKTEVERIREQVQNVE